MGKLSVSVTLVALLMGLSTTGVEGKTLRGGRRGRRHRVNPDGSSETYYPAGARVKGKPSSTKIRFTGGGPKGHGFVKHFEFPSSGSGPWPPHKPDPTPDPCHDLGPCEICVSGKKVAADYGASCSDGIHCNGEETCNYHGQCVRGDPVDCSDTLFGAIALGCGEPYCNEYAGECQVKIVKGSCDDPDVCTEPGTGICQHDGSCSNGAPKQCDDGVFCNGQEYCSATGECVPGDPVVCSDIAYGDVAPDCGEPYCNEYAGECQVEIAKGRHCDDPDLCTEGGTCQHDGSCRGTPKHCAGCTECDPYSGTCEHTCESHETCKHGKCTSVHPFPHHGCGAKLCFNHVCTWSHCSDCEVCEDGTCVAKECGDCHVCEHNQCVAKECGDCHVCEGNECVEQEHCGGKSYAILIGE